ncbi:MAG: tyrosine-protein phosphatase [Oceanospirillaceae bacterium]
MFRQITTMHKGNIYLHSMPGRKERWLDFKEASEQFNIQHILCLTAISEILVKSPDYAAAIEQDSLNCGLEIYEIEDFSTPSNQQQYAQVLYQFSKYLKQGENILIHCAAGIGRTGCAAICLLYELGIEKIIAAEQVALAAAGPETNVQRSFINSYQKASLGDRT